MGDKVISYFVVAGLGKDNQLPLKKTNDPQGNMDNVKNVTYQPPITDIVIINRSAGESPPPGYTCVEKTPQGSTANLNAGAIRCSEMYICYRRGVDRPPLTDIGVLYEGKERLMPGCEIIFQTPYGRPANVNNQSNVNRIFLLFRRAEPSAPANSLAVTDLCVMNGSKGESPPHTFCQIPKSLNRGLVGSSVYVCYKKSMMRPKTLSYEGQILTRYPTVDYPGFPLPVQVPLFCLPLGSVIESWPVKAEPSAPVFSRFVLTGADGIKVYGAAVSFYEPYPEEDLTLEQRRQLGLTKAKPDPVKFPPKLTVQTSKCICVLSKFPFYDAFRKFLSFVYRFTITGPHPLPVERHITHLINELPFPSQQRPRILYPLGKDMICLEPPEDSHLQPSGACYRALLRNLGPDNCLNLLLCVLVEQKVVIHSLRPDVVTMVAEAAANMIFPFHWQCPYIPLCPLDLSDVLFAPLPFIVGLDSRYFDHFEPPPDVICFDLDTNTVFMPEDKKFLHFKSALPKRPSKMLRATLQRLFVEMQEMSFETNTHESDDENDNGAHLENIDQNFRRKRQEQRLQLAIQEAFLRFMGMLLKGYGSYLLPVKHGTSTTDPSSLFEMSGFLKSREKAHLKFYSMMLSTQAFSRFLEERSFVSHKDASLAFFDDCIEKLEAEFGAEEDVRLVDADDVGAEETVRTVFVPPPDDKGLAQGMLYSYHTFPDNLKEEYFAQTDAPVSASSHVLSSSPPDSADAPACPALSSNWTIAVARRSRHEVRAAQKAARKDRASPRAWAKCLLGHVISLWFVHAPAFVKNNESRATKNVRFAYDVMVALLNSEFVQMEELGFRILMQLCGMYGLPVLAVKVMVLMKAAGIQPNAITYGLYNKAILESKHASERNSAYHLWRKLSHVVLGVAQFKRGRRQCKASETLAPAQAEGKESSSEVSLDAISRDSADSGGIVESGLSTLTYQVSPVSPSREDFRPTARPAKFADVERASTGGNSDRGYASMTKEEAREIASNLASPELSAPQFTLTNEALEFPSAGGIGPSHVHPVLEEVPLDSTPDKPQLDSAENEPKADSARIKVNEISHTVTPAIANAAASLSQSASTGLQGAVYYGSSYIEAAKPILQSSLEVASMMVTGVAVPTSTSMMQMEATSVDDVPQKKALTRSQTIGVMESGTHDDPSVSENNKEGESPWESPPLPRARLGSIVKIKPRKSHPADLDISKGKELETISHINQSAGLLLTSQIHQQSRFTTGTQHQRRQQFRHKPVSPDSPGHSRRFASSVDVVDRLLLERLVGGETHESVEDDLDKQSNVESSHFESDVQPPEAPGNILDAWGPWMTHDDSPTPPPSDDSLLEVNTSTSSSMQQRSIPTASSNTRTQVESSPSHKLASTPSAVLSREQKQQQGQEQSAPSLDDDESYSSLQLNSLPIVDDSPAALSKTPLKLPPPPPYACRRRLPLPPHLSENDLLSAVSTSSTPALKTKRSPSIPISSSMEGHLDGSSKPRSQTQLGESNPNFEKRFVPLTSSGSNDSLSARRGQPSTNATSPSAVYSESFNTPSKSILPMVGFDEPSPFVGSLMSFASNAASSLTSKWSGIKNSLSTPSRLGISTEELAAKDSPKPRGKEDNLLGGAAEEFEGAEGLSPPKSSRITGVAAAASLGDAHSTPMGTPFGTPQKPTISSGRGKGLDGSVSSIASASRSGEPEVTEVTSLDSHDLFGETLTTSKRPKATPNGDGTATALKACIAENGAWKIASVLCETDNSYDEGPIAVDISISSCTICQNCSAALYDEEIMAGWSPDDSNLSTKCPFCESLVVPSLTIRVRDFRSSPRPTRQGRRKPSTPMSNLDSSGVDCEKESHSPDLRHPSTPSDARSPPSSDSPLKSPGRRRAISECNTLSSASSTPGVNIDVIDDQFQDSISSPETGELERSAPHSDPVIVPYLSPLTLRKEVENVLETEGDWALSRPRFLQHHPICFWNLIFYFKRVDLVSHLPAFLLHDKKVWSREEKIHPSWLNAGVKNVSIRPLWDHQDGHDITTKPLYSLWNTGEPASFLNALVSSPVESYQSLMKELLASIACNDLLHPIHLVTKMREESFSFKSVPLALSQLSPLSSTQKQGNISHTNSSSRGQRSLYREILFLTICAYGTEDIDFKAFDWKYKQAFELARRDPAVKATLRAQDSLPGISALHCRSCFGMLPLL